MSSAPRRADAGPAAAWLATWIITAGLAIGADTVDLRCDGLPAGRAVSLVATGPQPISTAPDLADRLERPLRLVLVQADMRCRLQAVAHALGCWYTDEPGAVGAYRLSRRATLPTAPGESRVITSDLLHRDDLVPATRRLLAPWMGPGSGLDYLADEGLWSATLAPAGHAQLVEILATFSRCEVRVPPLVDDAVVGDGDRRPAEGLAARPVGDLVPALAAAWTVSVSLDADLAPGTPVPAIPPVRLRDLPDALAQRGVPAALVAGVLCLGTARPVDRRHPAERRRLAVLPLHHLCADPGTAGRLLSRLAARLGLDSSAEAAAGGWAMVPVTDRAQVIIAADPATIHRAVDLLGEADRLGVEAWLALPATP